MANLRWFIYPMIILSFVGAVPVAYGADILSQLHPYISVKGEYSDNLDLTAENQKKDFTTTITPGLKFSNMDKQSGIDFDASAGMVLYDKYSNLNYISANANLNAKYLTSSHFNFYLTNNFVRSDNPREREFLTTTADNKYVLATETQRAIYWRNVVAPTVEYQFGPENRVGVKYRNDVYQTTAIGAENSMENYVSPFLSYWFNRQHGISLDYGYTNGHFETSPDLNGHRVGGAYMFRFTPQATASLNGAYTSQTFTEPNKNYDIYDASLGLSYAFTRTLSASASAGYYWMTPKMGTSYNAPSFKVDLTNIDERTTCIISVQGGYTQDYFTSQNLGFRKYYRATGTLNHFLDRRFSIGGLGSAERSESDPGNSDTTWQAGANAAYYPFKWLTFSLQYTYTQKYSNIEAFEYKENRGMLIVTATY